MRNGKIAKLLSTVRDELNVRMDNGENGGKLLRWLNGLPEVKATLQASFGGQPVSKQNLCEWRQGGFREWQLHYQWIHQAYELNRLTTDMEQVLDAPMLAGDMAKLLAVRYAALLNTWDGEADPKFERGLRLLRGLGQDIALLQRTLHRSSLQEIASDQHFEDDCNKRREKIRGMAMAPILARMEQNNLERLFGNYVDEAAARRLAEFVTAIKFNLPLPKTPRPEPPGQTSRSNPKAPAATVAAVCDRRTRRTSRSTPAPAPVVAAVCDRRTPQTSRSNPAPARVVAAVCDRRTRQTSRSNPAPSAQPLNPSQPPPAPPGQTALPPAARPAVPVTAAEEPPGQTGSNVAPVKLVGTRVKVPPVELGCSRRNTTSTAPPRGGVGS